MPDITETLKADSTQLNAIDFPPGTSRTYTVASVRVVKSKDRPVNIRLAEDTDDREYRPSKGMRRILASCWGPDSDKWVGQRFTVYADPTVMYAGKRIGGLKVSHVTGIDAAKKLPLRESESVTTLHTIQPLADAPAQPAAPTEPAPEEVSDCHDVEKLKTMWRASGPEMKTVIEARVAAVNEASA